MAAKVQVVEVNSPAEIDGIIGNWVIHGYIVANRTPVSATMVKHKQFSVLWAVIGFVLCLLPLLVYCIVYAADSDRVVEIRSRTAAIGDPVAELGRMHELLMRGVISENEYEAAKQRLMM